MPFTKSIAIIIPCYNEAERLDKNAFIQFVENHKDVNFIFINDGSTDDTVKIIKDLEVQHPSQINSLTLPKNLGKGCAVRAGILSIKENQFEFIGYLDADLSTPIFEYYSLIQLGQQTKARVIFGSRIKKAGSDIKRSGFRHIVGRLIATIIDEKFKLGYYDTQCGAKIFEATLIKNLVKAPFYTKWFFDVEIFLRMRKLKPENENILEVPLTIWHSRKKSKINLLSFPSVIKELIILFSKY